MKIPAIVGLLTITAASFAADISGRYVVSGVPEMASELVLKRDGTFEYALIYGAADYTAAGAWKQDGDSVILQTKGTANPPLRLLRSAMRPGPGLHVIVKAVNGAPVPNIDVRGKRKSGEDLDTRTDQDGLAVIENEGVQSILLHVPVYDVEAGPFPLESGKNEYHFEIDGAAVTQVRFNNERLRLAGSSELELRFWNKDQPLRYRKR